MVLVRVSVRRRVRVRVRVWVRVDFRVGVRIMVNLTLTKTLKLHPNLLSYWECCRNMVMEKKFTNGMAVFHSTRPSIM